ncbi:MAG: c-type cytochrome [Gemmatimonadaceae bacterium]
MSIERTLGAAVAGCMLLLGGCAWFTDFKEQPDIDPWEVAVVDSSVVDLDTMVPRGNPPFSVPITGAAVPGYAVSYRPLPGVIDSMSSLANPTPVTEASLLNGRKYYQINCAVCHGMGGAGDGPVASYGLGISLLTPAARGYTDGYLFGMIRNGRGLMPTYNRVEEMDRWDVVNYIRALQGSTPFTADTSLLARPGETGDRVPGHTETAPTRPAPYAHPGRRAAMPDLLPAAVRVPVDSGPRADTTAPQGGGDETP